MALLTKTKVLMLVSYVDGTHDLVAGKTYRLPHDVAARLITKGYAHGNSKVEVEVDTRLDQSVEISG